MKFILLQFIKNVIYLIFRTTSNITLCNNLIKNMTYISCLYLKNN